MSDNDLERAIELFFETGGVDLSGPTPVNPPPRTTPSLVQRTPPPPPKHDDDEDFEDLILSNSGTGTSGYNNVDEDEALARRLMQEDIDHVPAVSNTGDGLRSPIAARNDILVHPDMDYDTHYGYRIRGRMGRGGTLGLEYQGVDYRIVISRDFQSRHTIDME